MVAYGDIAKTKAKAFPMFTPADNKLIFDAYDYYSLYLVRALRAIVEWRSARSSDYDPTSIIRSVRSDRDKYAATLPSRLPADGLVDIRTKLYWRKIPRCASESFDGLRYEVRLDSIRGQGRNGFKNWRLPTLGELTALVKERGGQEPPAWLNAHGFTALEEGPCAEYILSGESPTSCHIYVQGTTRPLVMAVDKRHGHTACVSGSPANSGHTFFMREMDTGERYW